MKNRTEQARRLGFCSYTDMKYASRFGFGREQIEAFRAQVLEKWVPFVCEIKENQRKRLGVPSFRLYDSPAALRRRPIRAFSSRTRLSSARWETSSTR